jgi:hypothetical protein
VHFNIGDEVVITGPTRCGSNAHIGKRFKITECDDIYFSTLDLPWFPWGSLELVPLTVGDWVEVVGVPSKIFQIDATDFSKWSGRTYYLDKERHQYPAKSLRKLAPEEIKQHISGDYRQALTKACIELNLPYNRPPMETIEAMLSMIATDREDSKYGEVLERLSAIEKRQEEARKYSDDLYSITETLAERIYALQKRVAIIEQRLSSLERLQNGQSKYLVKQWVAGP